MKFFTTNILLDKSLVYEFLLGTLDIHPKRALFLDSLWMSNGTSNGHCLHIGSASNGCLMDITTWVSFGCLIDIFSFCSIVNKKSFKSNVETFPKLFIGKKNSRWPWSPLVSNCPKLSPEIRLDDVCIWKLNSQNLASISENANTPACVWKRLYKSNTHMNFSAIRTIVSKWVFHESGTN